MVLNLPVSPAPSAPQALFAANVLEDGGHFLKASQFFPRSDSSLP